MKVCRFGLALVLSCAVSGAARAEISDNVVRVGVLNDISGIFQDTNGMGSVEAARMAAEDFNGGGKGIKVEPLFFPDANPKLDHEYQFLLDTREGQEALQRMLDFVRRTFRIGSKSAAVR